MVLSTAAATPRPLSFARSAHHLAFARSNGCSPRQFLFSSSMDLHIWGTCGGRNSRRRGPSPLIFAALDCSLEVRSNAKTEGSRSPRGRGYGAAQERRAPSHRPPVIVVGHPARRRLRARGLARSTSGASSSRRSRPVPSASMRACGPRVPHSRTSRPATAGCPESEVRSAP